MRDALSMATCLLLIGLATTVTPGCIPSEAPEKSEAPPAERIEVGGSEAKEDAERHPIPKADEDTAAGQKIAATPQGSGTTTDAAPQKKMANVSDAAGQTPSSGSDETEQSDSPLPGGASAVTFDLSSDSTDIRKQLEKMSESNTGVKVMPVDGGKSYKVDGAYGLDATITRPDPSADQWLFKGHFEFKKEGYEIDKPVMTGLQDGVDIATQTAVTIPGVTVITLSLRPPPDDVIETGETYREPIEFTLKAGDNPQFLVMIMPRYGPLPELNQNE